MTKKGPRIAQAPPRVKAPELGSDAPNVDKSLPLAWGLRRVDFEGAWGWRRLKADHIDGLHGELARLEGRTLHSLLGSKEIKDIPAEHLCRAAKKRLQALRLEEHDTLWELRLRRKRRAWGLVEGAVFHFLWWDPDETVCKPPPKGKRRR